LSLVEQVPTNSHAPTEATASEFIDIMCGLKEYLQNSDCNLCKEHLRKIFFKQNNNAGSAGGRTSEPGELLDTTFSDTHDIQEGPPQR
jgi:hypothetical protein